ncbi:hypothetical protein C9890_0422 [Perkinsus sp. BL_2016]|nr:hypothetical protein C9890_0422 [Perkinsus sp. BL_2016]
MDRLPTISGNSTRVVNTITGTKVLNVIPYLTLMGVTLENCLGQKGPLLHVEGIEIDGILGMDYIRAVGGIHVTFDENSRPLVEFHTPTHVLNAITQEATLVKRIDMKDFTLEQHLRLDPEHPEWKYKWTVQWKWLDTPQNHYGPPSYNSDQLLPQHRELLEKEVQGWLDLDFIQTVPHDERHKVEGLLSLIAVEQLHKPSTPVRPVLGFGLSISPKVLRVVLSEILPSDAFPSIDTYIDDNFLPVEDASLVRDKLREHGFETKEPEPVNRSRVLGLQNRPDGTWTRRGDTPRLERHTKRGVHSWTGKLVCHLPIARWLRPCVSALKRLCAVQDWDEPLNDHAVKACQRLTKWLDDRGDPCAGQWSYEPSDPWTLYTDASCTAYGAVLMAGNVYVEDQTYLRAPGDRRHINLAELIAVHKGIHLVSLYRKALRITESTTINLKCDNKSVVAWLTRAQERHWTSIKGMSAKVIEKHLLAISDDCQALGIKLKVDLIPSEENISDPLSRVPDVLRGPDQPFDPQPLQDVICMTQAEMPIPSFERDEYNRWKVDKETLVTLMLTMHEHEGAQTLYDRLRALVSFKDLRRLCQQFVRDCATCNLSKVTAHTAVLRGDAHMPQTFVPFSHVHMDISGPYGSVDNIDKAYVISLIDRHSRYVLTRATTLTMDQFTRGSSGVFAGCGQCSRVSTNLSNHTATGTVID